ncbi:hypothetical protein JZ751_011507, partial [Albula glossodonta]
MSVFLHIRYALELQGNWRCQKHVLQHQGRRGVVGGGGGTHSHSAATFKTVNVKLIPGQHLPNLNDQQSAVRTKHTNGCLDPPLTRRIGTTTFPRLASDLPGGTLRRPGHAWLWRDGGEGRVVASGEGGEKKADASLLALRLSVLGHFDSGIFGNYTSKVGVRPAPPLLPLPGRLFRCPATGGHLRWLKRARSKVKHSRHIWSVVGGAKALRSR